MDFELAKWICKGVIIVAYILFVIASVRVVGRVVAYNAWVKRVRHNNALVHSPEGQGDSEGAGHRNDGRSGQ